MIGSQSSALRWLWISALVILTDQITKFFAAHYLSFSQPWLIFPFLNLTLLHNTGAAFNILAHAGEWTTWLFTFFAGLFSILILCWLYRLPKSRALLGIALTLILGGATGNLIDRVSHGFVIDFIELHWQRYYWPVFNMADAAICVGAVMIAIEMLLKPKKHESFETL